MATLLHKYYLKNNIYNILCLIFVYKCHDLVAKDFVKENNCLEKCYILFLYVM